MNKYHTNLEKHNSLKKIISDRLINARKLANKSQREISKLMDKSPAWLSQIEAGAIAISTEDLIKLSAIYGTTPGQIIDINPTMAMGNLDLQEVLDSFYMKISNSLPVEIPVYLHSDYTIAGTPQPIDYIYWSRNKVSNRELILIHYQTKNLEPVIIPNDRLVIQTNSAPSPGIGAIWSMNRVAFGTPGLSIVEIVEKNGLLFWRVNNTKNADMLPLYENQFVGKVIQYIRAIDNTLVSRPYQTQPNYNNTGRGAEEWENTTEKIVKAPQNAILGQNE
ncbi:MAG: hypothetical protein CMM83_04165 [Rhodospirillales bacterium]|nr:hypothetical protein [Rhodospirillales bacterium]|tara:strand:+ start:6625 stop:7458 length:834 start_codon:yes stop_codon:yes gene_type:complete